MSSFARKKITNQDTLCDDEDATPTRANGHYIISNGGVPTSPTPLSPPYHLNACMNPAVLFSVRELAVVQIEVL
jgi:hypothetical protein